MSCVSIFITPFFDWQSLSTDDAAYGLTFTPHLLIPPLDPCAKHSLLFEDNCEYNSNRTLLFSHIAALIKGNRSNCAEFASASRLDWLIHRLASQESPKGQISFLLPVSKSPTKISTGTQNAQIIDCQLSVDAWQ